MSDSMEENWPDAIKCGNAVFIQHGAGSTGAMYNQVFANEVRNVEFNFDGSYKSRVGHDGSSKGCLE
jgi:hypothetical protein